MRFLNIRNANPFEDFDKGFEDFFAPTFRERRPMPKMEMRTDIMEKDGKYILDIDMPGFDKKDIALSLEEGYLTVTAEKKFDDNEKDNKGKYIRRERIFGSCSRTFYVGDISEKDINAEYKNGILTLVVPKEEEKKQQSKKYIEIK